MAPEPPPAFPPPADPPLVARSLAAYRLLLAAYPARFRREYGPWMAQAFRDQCLHTVRRSGPTGLPPLWGRTLLDWLKTIAEQRTLKGAAMTRSMFIRICGWCLVFSAAALVLAILSTALYSGTTDPRNGLYRSYDPWLYLGQRLFFPAFSLLMAVGLAGLAARYGPATGWVGQGALGLAALGGLLAFVLFAVLVQAGQGSEPDGAWDGAMLGLLLMFGGLTVFGIAALVQRALAGWSWLPLASGGLVLIGMLLIMGLGGVAPFTSAALLFGALACGLFQLGRLLLRQPLAEPLPV